MSTEKARTAPRRPAAAPRKRRGIGRPSAGTQVVGREAIVSRTCDLLREIPPNRLTRAEVARRLHIDPSLIRYYFKNRGALLLAAAEELTGEFGRILERESAGVTDTPEGQLRARIAAMLKFEIRYPFFHRLLLEEIVPEHSAKSVSFLDTLTRRALTGYASIIERGVEERTFNAVDPAFVFLTVVGACEFFVNGLPILKIGLGENLDESAAGARYQDFVSNLILNGILARRA